MLLFAAPLDAKDILPESDPQGQRRAVVLQLSWLNQFQFAGYYAALEKGFYRKAGLDVTILEGNPDRRPVSTVVTGKADYGVARSELLLHRLKGQPVVMLASIFQHSATILMAKQTSGIDTPQGMIGKRVMVLEGDDGAEFIAMFRNEDVSPDLIHLMPSSFNVHDLIEDKIDVFNAYTTNEPYLLQNRGIQVSIINPRTYGIHFYGDCLFTSEQELMDHPEDVQAFRNASIQGWRYALNHVDEMIDFIQNRYEVQKTRDHLAYEAKAIHRLMMPDIIEIGHTNPGRWAHIAQIYLDLNMADSDAAMAGFIYDPSPASYPAWLWRGLLIAVLAGVVTAAGAAVLLFFNRRLQKEVVVRRMAEDSLRQSESRYRHLINSINSGVVVYQAKDGGDDFIIKDFNKAGEHIENIASQDILGRNVCDVFPGVKELGLLDVLQRVWQTGVPAYHPTSFYKDERIEGWRDNYIYKLPSGEVVAVYTDETMRKRSEQEILWQKEQQSLLLDAIDTQVWYLSDPFTYGIVNKAHADFLGVEKEVMENKRMDAIRSSQFLDASIANNQQVFESKQPIQAEEWGINSTGERRLLSVTRTPNLDTNDDVAYVVCAGIDITDKKQLEEQLREAYKMKAIGTLSGGVAHEFNNLLAIILGNAELASDDLPSHLPVHQFLHEIQTASMRGKEVVRQLLSFSREKGKVLQTVDFGPLIDEAVTFLKDSLPPDIVFQKQMDHPSLITLGDSTLVHQVVVNLCTNAAQSMAESGGTITIKLNTVHLDQPEMMTGKQLPPGKYIRLQIADAGSGIDPRDIGRIFDPFFTTQDVDQGTGMGLAVVHGIMKSHGGGIKVRSQPGQGTTMECFFPYLAEPPQDEANPKQDLPGGKETILFIDDEPSMVRLGQQQLERLGYQVVTHTDPSQALEQFQQQTDQFNLVITDLTMPNLNGDQVIAKLKATKPDIKTILCTGYSQKINATKASQLGADELIMKPFDKKQMATTIRDVLDR